MAVGRLEKFFKGSVLNEQEFIKDSTHDRGLTLSPFPRSLATPSKVIAFDRLVRGGPTTKVVVTMPLAGCGVIPAAAFLWTASTLLLKSQAV